MAQLDDFRGSLFRRQLSQQPIINKQHTLSIFDGFLLLLIHLQQVSYSWLRVSFVYKIFSNAFAVSLVCYRQLARIPPVMRGSSVAAAPAIQKKKISVAFKAPPACSVAISHTVAVLYCPRYRCRSESPKREQNASLSPTWPLREGGGSLERGRCLPDSTWSNCCMSGTRTARFLTKHATTAH